MYKTGRSFEYKVIEFIKKHFPQIKTHRSFLSRKPDLIITKEGNLYLFEIKKTLQGKKMKCFVIDLVDYLNNKNNYEIKELPISDKFTTITKLNNNFVVVIPFVYDLDYLRDFKEKLRFYTYVYFLLLTGSFSFD
jgi:hypothetical protein